MNKFPTQKLEDIKQQIKSALDAGAEPIAAFDADGTLWPGDLGECLFKYQIKHNLLPDLPEDPYQYYQDYKKRDIRAAYLWLAQINNGLSIDQVRKWSAEALKEESDFRIFEHQKDLIAYMQGLGIRVYIVTASIKWAVEPGAPFHNIAQQDVIGIQTAIKDGKVTLEQEGPITYRQGKPEALFLKTQGKKPVFTSGNTEGDLFLLECASHVRLVLASAEEGETNFQTENDMQALAKERGWNYHDFRK